MQQRIEKLREILTQPGEAALITSDVNRYYLSAFRSSEGAVLVTRTQGYLLVDFRYAEAARKRVKHLEVIMFDNLTETLIKLSKKHRVKNIYIEGEYVSAVRANAYKRSFKEIDVTVRADSALNQKLNNMRIIKSRAELNKIKQAQKITEEAYCEVLNYLKPGVSEREIALELEFLMRKKGASGVAFDLITITGKKTSLPHGEPGEEKVREGDFFTMDIGAVFDGYRSDMTRTVGIKYISDKQREIYDIVLNAQLEALKKIRAGITCKACDKAARDIIENAGYGEFYKHATGHGVGLDIHEEPRLSPKVGTILSSGMIVTVEPGIYLPGKFGVRIEDMVCVTKNGAANLTNISKELVII
ncbi:MAG: M24 family metallopeptidase [Acutalibacteraceae bacterium]